MENINPSEDIRAASTMPSERLKALAARCGLDPLHDLPTIIRKYKSEGHVLDYDEALCRDLQKRLSDEGKEV